MSRPVGVTILAILAIVAGILGVLASIPMLGVGAFAIPGITEITGGVVTGTIFTLGLINLAIAAVYIATGIAAMAMRPWAWVMGVVVFAFSLLMGIVQLFTVGMTTSVVVSLLISAGLLAYMYSTAVRAAFDHEDGSLFHTGHTGHPMGA